MQTIKSYLSPMTYPGRGIIIGKTKDSKNIAIGYFIMGRSANSRNRIFLEDGDGIKTKAFDESKVEDPSLIIYNPILVLGDTTIVTNGDQTDTIFEHLSVNKTVQEALNTREFEPDGPNFTPRISGVINRTDSGFNYLLSILKTDEGDESSCERFIYNYADPLPGAARIIHTYERDEEPLPSFYGEPRKLEIGSDIDEFTNEIWSSLNEDNKISLYTRFIDIETGKCENRLINKNK